MWTADSNKENEEQYDVILAWLPKSTREDILERADLHIWWQESEGERELDDKTKALIKHTYVLASSQALGDRIDWDE